MTYQSGPGLVVWVPTAVWPGQLGLCGDADLEIPDIWTMLAREGAGLLAVMPDEEGTEHSGQRTPAEHAGLDVVPGVLPSPERAEDSKAFASFLDEVMNALLDGRQVVVVSRQHQHHGGLVAACLLMQAGLPSHAALALVRRAGGEQALPGEQEEYVQAFEGRVGETKC
ncbi:hypothetical protein DEDE109153_01465 [Deinococcus deserti]|uniref:Uncharacterized protein n=1 Tax=Deinococcus deserti (strain DSM 17065 / CIP 109153 / LMG 22923 / VCD115) TaxID=546414 RepID=C1CVE9_DEIDV|nr:hypothetical protein [Deinococcus deserti]ACO46166.1 hypothetical protein Deide_12461 [Deinococcus deserti VCD115]